MIITHISDYFTNYCIDYMAILEKNNPSFNNDDNSLTNNKTWWSGNILNLQPNFNINFSKTTSFIKNLAEEYFHKKLFYHYLHFINYQNGGTMDFHSHVHAEDYVFILYLNDCFDGKTNFYLKDVVSLTPKKSQIVFFESHIEHSGSFSQSKQILVGGLKKFTE